MRKHSVLFAGLATSLCFTTAAFGQTGDACDFVTTSFPSYQQVLNCYNSVPWCLDPTNPLLCDVQSQADAVEAAVESFSTVKGFVNAQANYRNKLNTIRHTNFQSDYQQFLAFQDLYKGIRNGHWFYSGPSCYANEVFSTIPLNFGSMKTKLSLFGRSKQIVYLEAPLNGPTPFNAPIDQRNGPGLAEIYRTQTGIDLFQYEGRRVVSINGVNAIDYFRNWAETVDQVDGDAGNGLMEILEFFTWSVRFGSFGVFPRTQNIEMVVADRFGRRERLVLPWLFIPAADVGLVGGTPTSSNLEFQNRCFTPGAGFFLSPVQPASQVASMSDATTAREVLAQAREIEGPRILAPEQIARRNRMARFSESAPDGRAIKLGGLGDFVEVPERKQNKDIIELLPTTDGARVVQYADDTVAIQLANFSQPWLEEVRFGVEYACANAERLILDLRSNGGGAVSLTEWLLDYLNPAGTLADRRLVSRDFAASPRLNELRTRALDAQQAFPPGPLASAWSQEVDAGGRTFLRMGAEDNFYPAPPLAPAPGYGNAWFQEAAWFVTVPDVPAPQLSGDIFYDVENGFDQVVVSVFDFTDFTTLAVFTGQSVDPSTGAQGFAPFQFDLSPWAGQNVVVVVDFFSDLLFSDQDGLFDSVLPLAIDSIEVTGGGPREDFNGGPLTDWQFFADYRPYPSCAFGFLPACTQNFSTQAAFTDPLWYQQGGVQERRGTDLESLSPLVGFFGRSGLPVDQNPCPGKFTGKDFLVVVNGLNASAGYFSAVNLEPVATSVMLGGYPDIETMFVGQARGGNIVDNFGFFISQLYLGTTLYTLGEVAFDPTTEQIVDEAFQFPIPLQQRDVEFTIEEFGLYKTDLITQNSVRHPKPVADVQVPFWSNSPETDGAAYRAAVSAVERDAIIEPACGDYRRYRTCFRYGRCVRRATDRAVRDGLTTRKDADRAKQDAIKDCVLRR